MEAKKIKRLQLENYSKIFFQIGLVLTLFIIYTVLKFKTDEKKTKEIKQVYTMTKEADIDIPILKTYNPSIHKNTPPPIVEKVIIVENTKDIIETIFGTTETDIFEAIQLSTDTGNINEIAEEEEIIEDVPFILIEDVPVYPGCKGNNNQLKSCFTKKIAHYFSENFDKNLVTELGLDNGKRRIFVLFRINKQGKVIDVKAKAPHPILEKEVIKIIRSLPKMIPGKQRGVPVNISYSIPITIEVR